MKMTRIDYGIHHKNHDGYCYYCDDVTAFGDIIFNEDDYECPQCHRITVQTVFTALLNKAIELEEVSK